MVGPMCFIFLAAGLVLQDARQACGITLTNAARMVVLDPVLDKSTLHQLLSRIHRYGQRREQEVTFLVVKDSMNELLHNK